MRQRPEKTFKISLSMPKDEAHVLLMTFLCDVACRVYKHLNVMHFNVNSKS